MLIFVFCHKRCGKAAPETQLSVLIFPTRSGGGLAEAAGDRGRRLRAGGAGKLRADLWKLHSSEGGGKKKKRKKRK